jgi:hypothetical protein
MRSSLDGFVAPFDALNVELLSGHTRARRYANHQGGKKYKTLASDEEAPANVKIKKATNSKGHLVRKVELPRPEQEDPIKAASARIFKDVWDELKEDSKYQDLLEKHLEAYDSLPIPTDLSLYLEEEGWLDGDDATA